MGPRVQVFGDDPGRVLHRHVVAGKTDHAGAPGAVQLVEGGALQRRGFARGSSGRGHRGRTSSGRTPGCVREMPPLSWTLRDSPRPGRRGVRAAAYSFGERPEM